MRRWCCHSLEEPGAGWQPSSAMQAPGLLGPLQAQSRLGGWGKRASVASFRAAKGRPKRESTSVRHQTVPSDEVTRKSHFKSVLIDWLVRETPASELPSLKDTSWPQLFSQQHPHPTITSCRVCFFHISLQGGLQEVTSPSLSLLPLGKKQPVST